MLMKSNRFLETEMLFFYFFCPVDEMTWQNGTRAVPGKQKASVIELVVDNSMNNSSSKINKISVFGKESTVLTDTKNRKFKHY